MSDRLDQDPDSQRATDGPDGASDGPDGATDGPGEATARASDGELRGPRDPGGGAVDDADGGPFGGDSDEELLERGPLEPGDPSLENAAFVLLGASGMVLLFLTAVL